MGPGAWSHTFWNPSQTSSFRISRSPDGRPSSLLVTDDPGGYAPAMSERIFTGAEEAHLGERCRVWRAIRPSFYGKNKEQVKTGCTTATGIEVSERWDDGEFWAKLATTISYQTVPPSDVRTPTEFLDVTRRWRAAGTVDHSHDYEVILKSGDEQAVARRSGAWTSVAGGETWGARTVFSLKNLDAGILFQFRAGRDGARRLSIERAVVPLPLNRMASLCQCQLPSGTSYSVTGASGGTCCRTSMMPGPASA